MYKLDAKIQHIKGVGPSKAAILNKAGIYTVLDLLERQPNHYIYPGITTIADAKQGHVIIKAKIQAIERLPHRPIVVARLNDGTGTCKAIWYNQRFAANTLRTGITATFWGQFKGGVLHQPRFTTCQFKPDEVCGGDYGVLTHIMRPALREVLDNVELPEIYPGMSASQAKLYRALHFPNDKNVTKWALNQLKFDELLLVQLAIQKQKQKQKRKQKDKVRGRFDIAPLKIIHLCAHNHKVKAYFPYEFTNSQQQAIREICTDISQRWGMSRLLQGEVGSGKTAVAFYAAILAALNLKRTLILCPTTILAQQHYDTLRGMGWDDVQLHQTGCDAGSHRIVIGTHSLLNAKYLLSSASLVIVDEFQKFGVEQRAKIQEYNPHLLLMSATPIPRTMMMSIFGDLDVSTIRELPIKRGTVITKWVLPDKREQMYEIIERELAEGHQVYVVYPRIDGGEDTVSANKGREYLSARWPKASVTYLTGKSPSDNKTAVLRDFKRGVSKILVSTIIAEVGLDNPNATVMVIEGADRFGLSQLHQLRGRVCRSTDTVYCFLIAETANQTSRDRLDVIEKCNDGFELAEHDLRLRGPGEMFSTRQHGLPDLKFASLVDDYDLLVKARDMAIDLVDNLDEPENAGLRQMLEIKYKNTLQLGSVE